MYIKRAGIEVRTHDAKDFLADNRYLSSSKEIISNINFPLDIFPWATFATIGERYISKELKVKECEFVVPFFIGGELIQMFVIRDRSNKQIIKVLKLLYPDLTTEEKTAIEFELSYGKFLK